MPEQHLEKRGQSMAYKLNVTEHADELLDNLSLIHISEPTRRTPISYAVFCLKKKKKQPKKKKKE